jgi:hypothetical protein
MSSSTAHRAIVLRGSPGTPGVARESVWVLVDTGLGREYMHLRKGHLCVAAYIIQE